MSAFDAPALIGLGRVQSVVPSPCGTWLAAEVQRLDEHNSRYVSDLWRVPLDGAAVQLTRGDQIDAQPRFRRDGALAFLSDRPTSRDADPEARRRQIWLLELHGGEPRQLTYEPLGVSDFRFASAADRLVVVAPVLLHVSADKQREVADNRRKHGPTARRYRTMPVRYWDHWLPEAVPHLIRYQEDGSGREDLTPQADFEHWAADWDVSADGTHAVITWIHEGEDRVLDRDLVLVDLGGGALRTLAGGSRVFHSAPRFSPDGRTVACARAERSDESWGGGVLWLFDTGGGDGRPLSADLDLWVHPACWSPDGRFVYVTADVEGHTPILRVPVEPGPAGRITTPSAGGHHASIHPLGPDRLVGLRSRFVHPPEPFVVAAEPNQAPEIVARLSGFDPARADEIAMVEDVRVPVAGGGKVQAFVLHPKQGPSPRPALVWIHGGPMAQWTDGWHWRWSPLVAVAAGYSVILPNPTGSTGFGQAFTDAIRAAWGDQCYRDVMSVAHAVAGRDDIDADRLVAMGGSFGGYMTNWIGVSTTRFAALVTHASIYDLSAFHGSTDFPSSWAMEWRADPWADREALARYSPRERIDRWRTPTLVIHGEKDYRVPIGEALGLFEALQAHGVPSELMVFPDEGHWIQRPRNVVAWYGAVLDFIERHTRKE